MQPTRTYSFWFGKPLVRYDADAQALRISLPTNSCTYVASKPNCGLKSMKVVETTTEGAGYVGQNAFGVQAHIDRLETVSYRLILPRSPTLSVEIVLPATPDEARAWKDSVGVLLTVAPEPSVTTMRILEGTDFGSPTLTNPVESKAVHRSLDMPVAATWVVNRQSCEVLHKFEGLP